MSAICEQIARAALDEVLQRLEYVRLRGEGYRAKCPVHDGKSRDTLSIRETNGRILFHCFAGCDVDSICDALQIKVSDLFSKPGTYQPKPHEVSKAEKSISDLRSRLSPRERLLSVTVVYCGTDNLDAGMARALALSVEGDEIVQCILEDRA